MRSRYIGIVILGLRVDQKRLATELRELTGNVYLPKRSRCVFDTDIYRTTRMWANAQRAGRPAEYRWRPPFNAAVWLTPTSRPRVPRSNAAKTRNPLKFSGVPKLTKRSHPLPASGPKFTIGYCKDVWRRYCCLTSFFFRLSIHAFAVAKI